MQKFLLPVAGLFLGLLANSPVTGVAQTTILYWDNNGTSTPTGGIFDTNTANWAQSGTALTTSTVAFTNGNFAVFTAGPTTAGTITVTNNTPNIQIAGLDNNGVQGSSCTLTLGGTGSFYLVPGTNQINISSGVSTTFNVPINGPGALIENGSGTLYLNASNSYAGGTIITGGQLLYYSNNASFGTGPITFTGTQSILNNTAGLITITNAWIMNNNGGIINFATGSTTCTGPWTLMCNEQIKNNAASTTTLTLSGPISGAFNTYYQTPNAGKIVLSGANTYTGSSFIGYSTGTSPETVSVTSINSVTTPAQQPSSSLGKPSSVANGTISIGYATVGTCVLVYTGPGETSDRVISLTGTTGGATIEMDGTGPLYLTSSFTVVTNGAKTLTLQGTSTATNTIGGAIPNSGSGATALTKAQAGTWVLAGTNTFSGNTTISAGTLVIGGNGKLNSGSYAGTIANAGIFNYSSSAAQTLSGVISGAGLLVNNGSGILTLSAVNTFTGGITNATSLTIGGAGSLGSGTYAGKMTNNGTFTYNSSAAQSITGVISGTGGITEVGTGTLTLNAAETFTGAITISSGTLAIGASGTLGGGTYANTITDNGTFSYGGTASQTISGAISGTGNLTESGSGGLHLTAANTYSGTTTISANDTLYLSGAGSISNSATLNIGIGGTLDVSALASPYTVSSTSLIAAGNASGVSAKINGATSGTIILGSQPMSLTFAPTTFTGDTTHPALSTPQAIQLGGNVITVNNNGGTPLGAGTYTLIQAGGGTTGNPSQYAAVTGAGIVVGDYATVQVQSGNVVLVVTAPSNVGPTWTGSDYANFQTWSDTLNWASGVPDATGDTVFFNNMTGSQTPVMDSSYSVNSLTFEPGCSPDVLTASGTNVLTVTTGVTNASGNLQIIATPVQLVDLGGPSVPSIWSPGSGITVSNTISDLGTGLAVSGGTLTLAASNTYTGGTIISNSATLNVTTLADANCSVGPSGSIGLNNGTLAYVGSATTPATSRQFNGTSASANTIDVPAGVTMTLSGRVTASAAWTVNKTDTGTLILSGTGDNSFLGMNVNGGVVILGKTGGSGHAIGNPLTVASGAEVQLGNTGYGSEIYNNATAPVTISSGGLFDLNGQSNTMNVLYLSGTGNSYNGNGGALINSASSNSALTCAISLVGSSTIGGGGNITLPGVITNTGALTYAGTGILSLGGASTFSAGTTVNSGGTLTVTTGGTTTGGAGTGPITLLGNSILNVTMGNVAFPNTVTGGSSNVINLNMTVAGNLTLDNTPSAQLSSFTGTINVSTAVTNGGQLVVGTAALIETINPAATWNINPGAVVDFNVNQTNPATVYLYGLPYTGAADGALRLDGSVQSGPVILMGNTTIGNGNTNPSTISGPISGSYGFAKTSGSAAYSLVLTGTNTYAGYTTIGTGPLIIGGSGSLGSGSYAGSITNNGSFIYNSSVAQTLSGSIYGTGQLNQEGPGNLTLNAVNPYTGATVVTAGTLALGSAGSLTGSSSITIAPNATFDVSAISSYTMGGSTTLYASGTGGSPCTINGHSGGVVNLGSQPISLIFNPASFSGDTANPALSVSQGSLALNGNSITVSNATGNPLGVGIYTLINVASGTITGTSPTATVTGAGIAAGTTASIQISGGSLNLVVAVPMPVITTGSMLFSGSNLIFSGSNGVPNGTFYVLTSTDVTLPFNLWTVLSTNTFSPTGNFNVTNSITNSASFYSIEIAP